MAGAAGGYLMGLIVGLLDGLSLELAIGLAGHFLLSGLLAGLVGGLIWKRIPGSSLPKLVVKMAVIGMIFFGSQTLIAPSYALDVPFRDEPVLGFIGGFLSGAFGGLIMWLFAIMRRDKNWTPDSGSGA